MESLWMQTTQMPQFEPLDGDRKTDVLIIGGGMAGLLCAYSLTQAGVNCTLVEANRLCGGTTGNTTAKITSQHGLHYYKLLQKYGVDRAKRYLQANEDALARYRVLGQQIPCQMEQKDNYVYTRQNERKLVQELSALNALGADAVLVRQLPLPFLVAGAIRFPDQLQFHPRMFAAGLLTGFPVFENTKVRELAPGRAMTDHGTISAEKIIIATHFPILNKHGGYFLKLYQHRSYVLALKDAGDVGGMYVDQEKTGLSFRNTGDLLMLGGGCYRTGKQGGGWKELEDFAKEHYPQAVIQARWAAQDCMSLDGIPYIGPYSSGTKDLYVATGFNKWGMSGAMVAAMILTDLVQGKDNPYADVFSPSRRMLHPQLAANGLQALGNLLTPTVPRCPHMGCALKYNSAEHSWDCPCHGSRFDETGKVLENPATADKDL